MDSSDRTHRSVPTTSNPSSTSELFICFPSRHSSSSSSMKKSSILSPGRARDPPMSLSTSLSRRLRTSGSIKNGQASPMFPTGGRKRGSGFENPEPSSPKVTCIGQVRVKTKKQGKKMRNLSRRRSGEVSFRKIEHNPNQIQRQSSVNSQFHQQECTSHRNQRWVHLPLTICETLRGFGSEFSCLFPCKSSCFSTSEREKEGKANGDDDGGQSSSCGAVFAKWLLSVQDEGNGGKTREIELVVGDEEEEEERPIRSSRRHVFDEIEIKDDIFQVKGNDIEGQEGRVSICIPPKNALLLMRCRSDPVKMEALASRFWEPQLPKEDEGEEMENDEDGDRNKQEVVNVEQIEGKDDADMVQKENLEVFEQERVSISDSDSIDVNEAQENPQEAEKKFEMEEEDKTTEDLVMNEELQDVEQAKPTEDVQINAEVQEGEPEEKDETEESKTLLLEEEKEMSFVTAHEALADQESEETVDKNDSCVEEKNVEESRVSYSYNSHSPISDEEICKTEEREEEKELTGEATLELADAMESTSEKGIEDKNIKELKTEEKVTREDEAQLEEQEEESAGKAEEEEADTDAVVAERESEETETKKEERERSALPECLLLMMCEPKLSMEVSKETWVCSTDFIRWRPKKKKTAAGKKPTGGEGEPTKGRVSVDANSVNPFAALPPPHPAAQHQPPMQPARSSCSLPARSSCSLPAKTAAVSMAALIEQKLVDAVAYEPFVLTRCKSAPMRSAAKLAPDGCFWKNGTLEPHRRATFGVGAAGVGF